MFKRLLIHEIKGITRDKMYLFLAIYPIIMAVIAFFLIPYLEENASEIAAQIVSLFFILMTGFMFGAITGFTLLDDQDDNVIMTLKITPISVRAYVLFKILISYLFGIIATLLILIASGFINDVSTIDLIYLTILAPMGGPIIALLINAFANNKVEGFVMMKLSGIILMAPVAALFLTDWKELFLGIIPGFWTTRIISFTLAPQDYFLGSSTVYFIFGLFFHLLYGALLFTLYSKKHRI